MKISFSRHRLCLHVAQVPIKFGCVEMHFIRVVPRVIDQTYGEPDQENLGEMFSLLTN